MVCRSFLRASGIPLLQRFTLQISPPPTNGMRQSLLGTAATVPPPDDRWCWLWSNQWNSNWQGRKPVPAPLCPPKIPHDLTRARTRAAVVGSQRLTAWAYDTASLQTLSTFCTVSVCNVHIRVFSITVKLRHDFLRSMFLSSHTCYAIATSSPWSTMPWRHSSTILDVGTRWKWMVSFTLRPFYPLGTWLSILIC
jgi:hypothetical protein